jgi:NAD(P)H-quinone oxidoreductase subunit 5
MPLAADLVRVLALAGVATPAALALALGAPAMAMRPLGERTIGLCVRLAFAVALAAFLLVGGAMWWAGLPRLIVDLGRWFRAGAYGFHLLFHLDALSLPFAVFTVALCGVVGAFAHRYLHREPGYARFFLMLAVFATGMTLVVLGGSIEVVLAGWELVGLTSALLVAFFHERPLPVRNGLRVFVLYRSSDACLLSAAVLVHHEVGSGAFDAFLGAAPWPQGATPLAPGAASAVAALLLVAAMGKCAQVPFSGWLPRAMEGPTPSSAIFYGALSIHAGAYLLLRAAPLLERAPAVAFATGLVGLVTAAHATVVGRVQTDIKSALAYASLTQVGIVLLEIALGLRMVAVVHIFGHACLRSLQFLRAPTLLHDLHQIESAVGGDVAPAHRRHLFDRLLPRGAERALFRFALERAHLDTLLDRWIVAPLLAVLGRLDALERRVARALAGGSGGRPRDDEDAP